MNPLKIEVTEAMEKSALRGFGITTDLTTGAARRWYVGTDGIKRWDDNDQPTEPPRANLAGLLGDGE